MITTKIDKLTGGGFAPVWWVTAEDDVGRTSSEMCWTEEDAAELAANIEQGVIDPDELHWDDPADGAST